MTAARRAAAYLLATCALAALPSSAWACGGFFCNAATQSPIFQAGERIVFAREGDRVVMHVEIAFAGEPTDFGWFLPLPGVPTTDDGEPVALPELLKVSTVQIFDRLQAATDPIFRVNNTFDDSVDACGGFPAPTSAGGFADAAASADSGGSAGPGVVVLQRADVGPFAAEIVQSQSTDALFDWLEENGYIQDENARPILSHYVDIGYVFLGLKLQNGKATGDLRPIQLNLGPVHACVPLRLTAIAATPDMPMLIWVLGDHRAIPKNFMHAVVNPKALSWPGGQNYVDVVTAAIDHIRGRAFVTDYADDEKLMANVFDNGTLRQVKADVAAAETAVDLANALRILGGANDAELLSLLQQHVPMPEGLLGYPHGNCFYEPGNDFPGEDFGCEPNDDHVTTEDEFYGFLDYWLPELARREAPVTVDVAAMQAQIEEEVIAARERIQDLFDGAAWITRFFSTISDSEMTRDPIFAFNPDLGPVDRTHVLETVIKASADCEDQFVEANYPDGSQVIIPCPNGCFGLGTVPPIDGEPALLDAQVADEQGQLVSFHTDTAAEIDQLLDAAEPGTATLPATYEVVPPEDRTVGTPQDPEVAAGLRDAGGSAQTDTSGTTSSGADGLCRAAPGQISFTLLAFLVGLLALRRRRATGA